MLPTCVQSAIEFFSSKPATVDRAAVMAYATLYALKHYYPDRMEARIEKILSTYAWIRTEEPGRILKQKRIMSWKISREIHAGSITPLSSQPFLP